ncbi:MAG: phage terminase large subunit [Defluviitaleaceae bacterium]|nr:phage terminase large subunit [Defluviitaleaceae bacterium]
MKEIILDDIIIPKYDGVLQDILAHNHIHYTFPSGRASTKSSFVATRLPDGQVAIILLMIQPENRNCHAICFRKIGNTVPDSVFENILFAINILGLGSYFVVHKRPHECIYIPTGQKILFKGLDNPHKLKSLKARTGYFAITWFEEFDQYSNRKEIRNVLQTTMRGDGERYWNFETYNVPRSMDHWVNEDILEERADRLVVENVTYRDVPIKWLGEPFIAEANFLKATNEESYKHEYLGITVGHGGTVFNNITERRIEKDELAQFEQLRFGIDFGFSMDEFCPACRRAGG